MNSETTSVLYIFDHEDDTLRKWSVELVWSANLEDGRRLLQVVAEMPGTVVRTAGREG